MAAELRLAVLALPGLSPDSLGNYLASLGLLRVLSRKWPSARIAWRDEVLQLIAGPTTLDEVLDELVRVVAERAWTPYERGWLHAQMKGTKLGQKKKTISQAGTPISEWRAKQPEEVVSLLDSHIVATVRQMFNPLTGNGGSAGNRDFSDGWRQAVDALDRAIKASHQAETEHAQALAEATRVRDDAFAKAEEKYQAALKRARTARTTAARERVMESATNARKNAFTKAQDKHLAASARAQKAREKVERPREELNNLLQGHPTSWLEKKLGAGSWFSAATKAYNSGQSPSREALVSPWAMVLACEGLSFFAGGPSRRLGARSRAVGAFPFITKSIAPVAEKEAGRVLAEVWAPLWHRPMTLIEAQTLFLRGRAELHGHGATTPAAFATAILKRGVDAGVSEFRRFTLGRTTSANTFEPRLEARFLLEDDANETNATCLTLERVTALIDQRGFPRDRQVGQRWRFAGLRGPIEAALLEVAAEPNRPEAAVTLVDAVVAALDRIDRNRGFRENKVRWEPLPLEWLPCLFADEQAGVEARLALALVSGFPAALPFAAYRFGVEWRQNGKYDWTTKPRLFEHSKVAPARWVWGPGDLHRVLGGVLARRLLEEAKLNAPQSPPPVGRGRAPLPAQTAHVRAWLTGEIDESLMNAWLSRLALFDWRTVPPKVRALSSSDVVRTGLDSDLALVGLAQPLVDQRPLVIESVSPDDSLSEETGARTAEAACSLVTLIRAGRIDSAVRLASSRYAMTRISLASFGAGWGAHEPERLAAALLFTISDRDRAAVFERWLRPRRRQQGREAHV